MACLPRAGHGLQRLGRDREAVADAAGLDHDVVGPADQDLAADRGDHPTGTSRLPGGSSACAGRAWPAWQIATASASAAWSDCGGSRQAEQGADHALDLLLGRRAASADRHLHRLRRVVEARDAALGGGQQRDAAGLADGDRRAHVLAEVDVLERHARPAGARRSARRARRGCAPGGARAGSPARRLDDAAVDRAHLAARHADDAEPGVRHARVDAHDDDHRVLILARRPDAS